MKSYTKVYLKHFNYSESDFIPCEVCERKAVDIHHIQARSGNIKLLNDITNLMALCREHHVEYGDKKQHKEFLQKLHNQKLEIYKATGDWKKKNLWTTK